MHPNTWIEDMSNDVQKLKQESLRCLKQKLAFQFLGILVYFLSDFSYYDQGFFARKANNSLWYIQTVYFMLQQYGGNV